MQHQRSPTVYVIAGPNGAGKTTFATTFLPDFANCREFLNADLIAAGLSPFSPESQNVLAGRLLLTRMRELTAAGAEFGFETTLAGRSYVRQFAEWRRRGYRIVVFFLWLSNVELAIARVARRVRHGGHRVPELDVRRRFTAGLINFWSDYRALAHHWRLYQADANPPQLIAEEVEGQLHVDNSSVFARFCSSVEA